MKQIQNKCRGWQTQKGVTAITILLLITITIAIPAVLHLNSLKGEVLS